VYRETNKEKLVKQNKVWQAKNADVLYEKRLAYYKANRKKIVARSKAYTKKNKEKVSARQKKFYRENREYMLAKDKAWRDDNREEVIRRNRERWQRDKDKLNAARREHHKTPEGKAKRDEYNKRSYYADHEKSKVRAKLKSRKEAEDLTYNYLKKLCGGFDNPVLIDAKKYQVKINRLLKEARK
jgi:hypothetical protein